MSKAAPAAAPAPTPSLEELNAQRDDLIDQLRAAQAAWDSLRGQRYRAGGLAHMGQAGGDEVDRLDDEAATAERHFNDVRSAVDLIGEALQEAEAEAEAARVVELRRASEEAATRRTASLQRVRRSLDGLQGGLGAFDDATASIAAVEAALRAAHADEVAGIESTYRDTVKRIEQEHTKAMASAKFAGATER